MRCANTYNSRIGSSVFINAVFFLFIARGCNNSAKISRATAVSLKADTLPASYSTPVVRNNPVVTGWPYDKTPVVPEGFTVTKFADGLDNPRWIYVAPDSDIFVSMANTVSDGFTKTEGLQKREKSSNTILIFRDEDGDGNPELKKVFLKGLNRPLGMLILNNKFYVANTDGLWTYPYQTGQTEMTVPGKKIVDLPAGGYNNHWTRNIISNRDGSKIYISVGSGSNAGEHGTENEIRRANILEINPDGTDEKIYASGLRNPVGMAFAPGTKTLWTAVNERDNLGDGLVPDYITGVKPGAYYGWPYAYFGTHEDPRRKGERPDLVAKSIVPDVSLGSHTASLGIAFYDKNNFPSIYHKGAFVAQHGSWNHSTLVGYRVVFIPFKNGKPAGPAEDFLTGFIADTKKNQIYGRPVCVAFLPDGSMLVSDDAANTIWRIAVNK